MKMIKFCSVILTMFLIFSVTGCLFQRNTVSEVTDAEFVADYRNDLKTLSSDEFQGRKPGTPGGKMTQQFLINRFKSIGLEPGNNGSYLQEVKLVSAKTGISGVKAVNKDGKRMLTTQFYIAGDPRNERDGILRAMRDAKARKSLLVEFKPLRGSRINELTAKFDIVIGGTPEDPDFFRQRRGG